MTLKYYDEDNCQHDVVIPNIDDLFDTEEEMIKAIKDACKEYIGEDDYLFSISSYCLKQKKICEH